MSKTKCEYCGGVTTDDEQGNCSACGAPRSMENHYASMAGMHNPQPVFYSHLGYAVPVSCAASTEAPVSLGSWYAST